jgi:hypothetical protein
MPLGLLVGYAIALVSLQQSPATSVIPSFGRLPASFGLVRRKPAAL